MQIEVELRAAANMDKEFFLVRNNFFPSIFRSSQQSFGRLLVVQARLRPRSGPPRAVGRLLVVIYAPLGRFAFVAA